MKIHSDSPQQDVRIELIPLIDVIFCILTFFILAAVAITRQTAINVDLPTASTGAPQMRDMLIVSVDPVGQLYIDKQPVTQDELYQALLQYQQENPQGLMVLYASRLSSYNDVVQVLDLLRSVGGDRVALATLPDGGATSDQPTSPLQAPNNTTPGLEAPIAPLSPFDAPGTIDPYSPNQPLFPVEPQPLTPGTGSSNPAPATKP